MSQAPQPEPEQESEPAIETKLLIMPAVTVAAAMAAPTRPATIKPDRTGANSRVRPMTTMVATALSALKREEPT